ncbi:MAG: phosphoenolpyruvate--protein phosphotransferase [Chitinivibrionales bacterium]|nr:phosphoenolpyruvate--protein phosphotransferase [Chitinivibrionales bacterium]MBD3396225.1 phosphoenolpyruvate--protein phosphotransferase [Chitinivibrionales bacterium]
MSGRDTMAVFKGLPISSGKVSAPVCLYSAETHRSVSRRSLDNDREVDREITRFRNAVAQCSEDLDRIHDQVAVDVGKSEAEIFLTQKHIMNDPAIVDAVEKDVRETRTNVEQVITDVYRRHEEKFALLDDEYLRERSTDLGEIRRRLLDNLSNTRPGFKCQGQAHCTRGKNRVIVAQELTADMMVRMNLESVLGIVTEHGGFSSHAALIARSVGVPAVSGVRGVMDAVQCGTPVLVDGDDGRVFVNPTEDTIAELTPPDEVESDDVCLLQSPPGSEVLANASILEDVRHAATVHADGIGLFRTEIQFMRANRLLSEHEQFEQYATVMRIMDGKPVTFRLIDVGGDKQLPFLRMEQEENPSLGWRGARFLLGSRDVFSTQVRALVRLSKKYPVRILFPMVIDSTQLKKLKDGVREIIVAEGGTSDNIKLGAMFEVPSACVQADTILKHVDFGSIGSNDLIQYLFAVDRNNEMVSQDYNPDHPALWEVLRNLSRAARDAGKPLSICGEMAGREQIPARLWDAGIRSLSVGPRLVPRVRNELMTHLGDRVQ